LRRRFQIGEDPGNGLRSRIAAIAKIEDKSRIANDFASETGRRSFTLA
jgi:hypothetical protein